MDHMEVYKIASDGNCLFSAVLHQMHLNDLQPSCSVAELRTQIISYIHNNIDEFVPTILDSCRSIYTTSPVDSDKALVNKYLSDLKHDGFWGGAECLCAISNIKNIRINVYYVNSTHPVVFLPNTRSFIHEIHLLYSGNHYDSLMPRSIPTSLSPSTTPFTRHYSLTKNVQRNILASTNPYILIESSEPNPSPPSNNSNTYNFGTWNIRGLNNLQKRDRIDSILFKNSIDICSVQEINMGSAVCTSENYTWYLSNIPSSKRRGVGLLIRKNSSIHAKRVKYYYGSIVTLLGYIHNQGEILIISTYVPPQTSRYNRQRSAKIFSTLYSIIDRCPKSRDLILLGDFNARFGFNDTWDQASIGSKLYHGESNENGTSLGLLASSARLFVETTKGRRLPLCTWTDGHNRSQVDHILTRRKLRLIYINSVKV